MENRVQIRVPANAVGIDIDLREFSTIATVRIIEFLDKWEEHLQELTVFHWCEVIKEKFPDAEVTMIPRTKDRAVVVVDEGGDREMCRTIADEVIMIDSLPSVIEMCGHIPGLDWVSGVKGGR